ncbi:hypothetical protein IWQ61_006029 [Dispira simplex]|nr:hypothetical protein IWQ61_006029 [Dispira simplex]
MNLLKSNSVFRPRVGQVVRPLFSTDRARRHHALSHPFPLNGTITSPFRYQSAGTATESLSLWNGLQRLGQEIHSRIGEIMQEAFLWAVPKKKTTHSKRRMRDANKAIKDRRDITKCPACGRNKLLHHICLYCYRDIKKRYREKKLADGIF